MIVRLDGSLVPALVTGESGVGKELVARAIHAGSTVCLQSFVAINCGALPRELVASALFGHRRGAFTGAIDTRRGAFASADGGTLFLDEIGELPLEVQPMLLRALETGEVQPLGDEAPRRVRVRIIAATNRDLDEEVRAGRFREDLYYRLAVVKLQVPPLRDRRDDIEPLAAHFARAFGAPALPPDVVQRLKARPWPGNARELRNVVQAFAVLGALPDEAGSGSGGLEQSLAEIIDLSREYAAQKDELADRFTRVYLQALMAHAGGNQTAAARIAGLDRTYLGRLLVKHGLSKS
jgi:transcriptional regulator with GAF, ATPase, and Fis domain